MTPWVLKKLPSGYLMLSRSRECWAQFPPGACVDTVPDKFIFHPEWNREAVNAAWKRLRDVIKATP